MPVVDSLLRSWSSATRRPPLKNENQAQSFPWDLLGVSARQDFFLEMYSVAKNASTSFARLQIYTFFHNDLKNRNLKIGLTHALGTYLECP